MDGIFSASRLCSRAVRRTWCLGASNLTNGIHHLSLRRPGVAYSEWRASTPHRTHLIPSKSAGVVRHMSTYGDYESRLELPDDLRTPVIEYARLLMPQLESLETVAIEGSSVRNRSKLNRVVHFLQNISKLLGEYDKAHEQIDELKDMMKEPDLKAMAESETEECKQAIHETVNQLATHLFPQEEVNDKVCTIEIRPGIGGTDAAMFAEELFEMYERLVRYKGGTFTVTSMGVSQEGGIKEVYGVISGKNIFGLLRHESGIHRVQREAKSDSSGRRHTSAAAIIILPQPDDVDLSIEPKDLQFDLCKASGAGGQHVQTTESVVRVTHIPTGISFRSESSRVQSINRQNAMALLKAKLYDIQQAKISKESKEARSTYSGRLDYSQKIRTFCYQVDQVQEHRFNFRSSGMMSIMTSASHTADFLDKVTAAAKLTAIRDALEKRSPPNYASEFQPKAGKGS